jgi:hypothetical protein
LVPLGCPFEGSPFLLSTSGAWPTYLQKILAQGVAIPEISAYLFCIEQQPTTLEIIMAMQIKRSSTGKYHLGSTGSTNADCNQRMYTSATTVAMAMKAPHDMICEKCFRGLGHEQITHLVDLGRFEK